MKMTKRLLAVSIAAAGVALAGSVQAATTTGTLTVTANVPPVCFVSSAPVHFADYAPGTNTAEGAIRVQCSRTLPYNIAMDAGLHVDANLDRRVMHTAGTDFIPYGLHKVNTWNDYWGDQDYAATTKGTSLAGTGDGFSQLLPVYGYSRYYDLFTPGDYSDVVTVTVHY